MDSPTLKHILDSIKDGKTAYIATRLKTVKVDKKTLNKWDNSGYPLFKEANRSLFIARGRNYDCIDYCKITVV